VDGTVPAIVDGTSAVRTSVCISGSNTYVRVKTTLFESFLRLELKIKRSVGGSNGTADFGLSTETMFQNWHI